MAPTSKDPKELQTILNPARRRALTSLVTSITATMHANISDSMDTPTQAAPLFLDQRRTSNASSNWTSPPPINGTDSSRTDEPLESRASDAKLWNLKRAALKSFNDWEKSVTRALDSVLNAPVNPRDVQQRERAAKEARAAGDIPGTASLPHQSGDASNAEEEKFSLETLQKQYPPTSTRLATIPRGDLVNVLSSILLLLLSLNLYSATSRIFLLHITSSFNLPLSVLIREETELAKTLLLVSSKSAEITAEAEEAAKQKAAAEATNRRWKVGLASLAGAAVIGITGGLAAPVVAGAIGGLMGAVGMGGVASFLGIFAMNGALMGSVFGVLGAKGAGERMEKYVGEVKDFAFLSTSAEEYSGEVVDEDGRIIENSEDQQLLETRRLRITIGINGWLEEKEDVVDPWKILGKDTETFALRYEQEALLELGTSLKNMVTSYAWSYIKMEILRKTVLATLWASLWPVYLVKMATSVDSPFSVAKARSEKAGKVLADALIHKAQGNRPVTLVGYSLGARVVYSCLNSLAERKAFGLVEDVVFIGAPVPSNPDNWRILRSVVAGQITNVYSENDYILGFLYRATSIQYGVAGLQEIKNITGVNNLNLSNEVSGHLRYPDLIGKILKRAGFTDVLVQDGGIEQESEIVKSKLSPTESESELLFDFDEVEAARREFAEINVEKEEPKVMRRAEEKVPRELKEEIFFGKVGDGKMGKVVEPAPSAGARDDESDDEGGGGIQMMDNE